MKKLRNKQGFTLIEVVVVMAIIAVLAVLVVGAITVARNTAKETANRANAKTIQTGQEATFAKDKKYWNTTGATLEGSKVGAGNVSLATGGCASTDTDSGSGGWMVATDTTYTIYVADKDCDVDTTSAATIAATTIAPTLTP